jgi:hypothetical protein
MFDDVFAMVILKWRTQHSVVEPRDDFTNSPSHHQHKSLGL